MLVQPRQLWQQDGDGFAATDLNQVGRAGCCVYNRHVRLLANKAPTLQQTHVKAMVGSVSTGYETNACY